MEPTDQSADRRATLIFNPVAGAGDARKDLEKIRDLLDGEFELDVRETAPDAGARQLTEEALRDGVALILAAGGDGTVAETADVLAKTRVPLGIIPRGTANALAVALFGDGLRLDPIGTACKAIRNGRVIEIDTALCEGRRMLLLAGIGIEAGMVEHADRESKSRFGVLAYLAGGWKQIRSQEEFEVTLEAADGGTERLRTASLVVANAAPPSSIFAQGSGAPVFDDGKLDVTALINTETPLEKFAAVLALLNAALTESQAGDRILHFRTPRVRITASPRQKLVLDGEIIGATPMTIECARASLRVIAPAGKNP